MTEPTSPDHRMMSLWGEERVRTYLTSKFDQLAGAIAEKDVVTFYRVLEELRVDGFPDTARYTELTMFETGLRRLADRISSLNRRPDPGQ